MKHIVMKRIKIDNEYYDICFKDIRFGTEKIQHWNAYVILGYKKFNDGPTSCLPWCTYYEKGVYGVDTAHFRNIKMTSDEKLKDAEIQIKGLIKDFNKR